MGLFDSSSQTYTGAYAPSQSQTINALGSAYGITSNVGSEFVGSGGNYAPNYSFSTVSSPTVNATTNLSVQAATNSPGANFSASQTASTGNLTDWLIAGGAVIIFFWLYHKYR